MTNLRVQLSLQFKDEDLIENFIKPYKEERRLNSVVIKCLSSYYHNEEVRNLVEGVSLEDITGGEVVKSDQALFNEIRQVLMMQDYMAQELQNTMDNDVHNVEDILGKTNEMAESTSKVYADCDSETGNMFLRIGELPKVGDSSKSITKPKKSSEVFNVKTVNNSLQTSLSKWEDSVHGIAESMSQLIASVEQAKEQAQKEQQKVKQERVLLEREKEGVQLEHAHIQQEREKFEKEKTETKMRTYDLLDTALIVTGGQLSETKNSITERTDDVKNKVKAFYTEVISNMNDLVDIIEKFADSSVMTAEDVSV